MSTSSPPFLALALIAIAAFVREPVPLAHAGGEPQQQQDPAESWDAYFRKIGPTPLEGRRGFPLYCTSRLLREKRLQRGAEVLVLAMGDGRNAVPFARQGLAVTGVDVSSVALEHAREAAAEQEVTLEMVQADLSTHDLGVGRWDLVTNVYFNPAIQIFSRIKDAVRPGGFLLVEGYGADYRGSGPPAWSRYRPNQLLEELAGWRILEYQDGVFASEWAQGQVPVVRVLAQRPLEGPEEREGEGR